MSLRKWIAREIIAFFIMIVVATLISSMQKSYDQISYAEMLDLFGKKDISEIGYYESGKLARVLKTSEGKYYHVGIVSNEKFEEDVYKYSLNNGSLKYYAYIPSSGISFGHTVIILIISSIVVRIVFQRIDRKLTLKVLTPKEKKEFEKNEKTFLGKLGSGDKYNLRRAENVDVKFSDVIGLEKQIDEVQDIVRFLREPEKYEAIGAILPKGILLYGKPGVGKTYIARAIAGEANVPFFETSASELQSKYLGESEERIRAFFKEAEEKAPSIIYIDEIDSIATQRYSEHSNRYSASIVNQLLACMDGFSKDSRVIVIAATNHVDALDKALLRSGRFDRKIYIQEPDKEARKKLINYYSKDKVLDSNIDIDKIVEVTAGLTGADIKTILNEAAILSVRINEESISDASIMEAFRKVVIGNESNQTAPPKERLRKTAVHEAGHAVVSRYFGLPVSEISIIARGNAAGYNLGGEDSNTSYEFEALKHRIMSLLAGRAAEELVYKEVSAGASDDLKRASSIIESMVLRFSMHENPEVTIVLTDNDELNKIKAEKALDEMEDFIKACYKETLELLKSKMNQLQVLTQSLMQKETLSKHEIEKILD